MKLYKVVVIGGKKVGKTTLVVQFIAGHTREDAKENPDKTYCKEIEVDSVMCKLNIIDTPTNEEYFQTSEKTIPTAEGYILVYSITSNDSFNSGKNLITLVLKYRGGHKFPMVVVGNKVDLEFQRQVATDDGKSFAAEHGAAFLESSALNIDDINHIFAEIVREINKSENSQNFTKAETKIKTNKCCIVL